MAIQNHLELLHRPVEIEIVKVIESGLVQRIARTIGERFGAGCPNDAIVEATMRLLTTSQVTRRESGKGDALQ
jgi:hypothetical protein